MGRKLLRKIQMGAEGATPGTPVAATTIWRGTGMLEDKREVRFVEEDVGYLSGVDRTYIPKLAGAIEFDEIEATFEQLTHILRAGVEDATPTIDGAGTDYIYQHRFPTTAERDIETYTIEGGDDQQAEEMEYSFVESFELSGEPGEAIKVSGTWIGRQVEPTTFTGAIALPTVEDILFLNSKLYIDDASGAYGDTQKTQTFMGFNLSVTTGWIAKFTGDGELYFEFHANIGPEITCEVTFEHDGTATAEKTNWRNQTSRLIRIINEGSEVATPGTVYTYKSLIIDLPGKWETFDKIDEQDGNDIIKATFRSRYNETIADAGEIMVVNEESAYG